MAGGEQQRGAAVQTELPVRSFLLNGSPKT
jgi:hypothetical protein